MNKVQRLPLIFGTVIAETRMREGITQEQLAEAIGSTNVYISLLENGQRQPSLNAMILIANSLGIAPEKLMEQVSSRLDHENTCGKS
ncbi:MAG: XRE family transcriptional regulator [Desulfovibrionaceae bacterium]|nr:MAG: XRE family transcriptional regulator [Desulfovibrionaceae bacterium]